MRTVSDKVRFIQAVFGSGKVSGSNITVHCPECKNADAGKKKLSIRLEDDLTHCWVCGWGSRTLLPLVIKHGTSAQVLEYKKEFLPDIVDVSKRCYQVSVSEEQKVVKLPSDFKLLVLNKKTRDPDVRATMRYVESRGLSESDAWRWKLGTSNTHPFRRRVILPSFDHDGSLNYYTGRAIDKMTFMKYANCDADKLTVVINELNIDWSKRLTLVEGPFDLMKCQGNVTCLLGSSLSEKSELFHQILVHETPVVLMLDNDMQGKMQIIAKKLATYNIPVWIASLGNFHDPGQMSVMQTESAVALAKKWTWDSFLFQKLEAAMSCSLRIKGN